MLFRSNVRALAESGERLAMSFTFRAPRDGEEWSADRKRHRVTQANLGHVTVLVAKEPAYPQTTASFRALAERLEADVDDMDALMEALREGRQLTDTEYALLERTAAALRPEQPEPPALNPAIVAELDTYRARMGDRP